MTIVEELVRILKEHLPHIPDQRVRTECFDQWANLLLVSNLHNKAKYNVIANAEDLKELEKSLRRSSNLILSMEYASRNSLNRQLAIFHHEDSEPLFTLLVNMKIAQKAVELELRAIRHRKKASKKVNWRAVSVVDGCRLIWALAEREANRESYGPDPLNELATFLRSSNELDAWRSEKEKYEEFLKSFAPTSQHHTRPGPFGRFAEAVFSVLGVTTAGDSDQPVSAATALDALARIERQEKCQ